MSLTIADRRRGGKHTPRKFLYVQERPSRPFPAHDPGICWECLDDISIGDKVAFYDEEVVHYDCIPLEVLDRYEGVEVA